MKEFKILFVLLLFCSINSFSQNVAITDDDAYSANSSAMLDVKSVTKGFLIPRLTTTQRNAIVAPATGLLVFDTSLNGFYYFNGSVWVNLSSGSSSGLIWSYSSPNAYLTGATDRVGIGTNTPLHKLHVVDNVTVTDGTDGSFIDIQNSNASTGVMSGIRFFNGITANTAKGGLFYQDKLGYGVGDMILANNINAVTGNVAATDAKLVIRNNGSVEVKGTATANASLFHVLNSTGDTIFAVYDGGVRINVFDDPLAKASGSKGGFAVGGFSPSKGTYTNDYLKVTPDSVRVYIEDGPTSKASGSKGGFAVGGFSPSKAGNTSDYLNISSERTKVFMTDPLQGFAVNNIETGEENLMNLTKLNYFIGHQSGKSRTSGVQNSVLGYQAGMAITSGGYNSFFGYLAGAKTTYGQYNTFIGPSSGYSNIGGGGNAFVGFQTGYNNTSGENNIFIGYQSGYTNTIGNSNTFLDFYQVQTTFQAHRIFL
jgi:trimeric autotransporter adhesin